jgi:hypothetical protein
LEGGPPGFQRDFACPAVLTGPNPSQPAFAYGTLTHSGRPFQQRSASSLVSHSVRSLPQPVLVRSTPRTQRRQAHTRSRFRLLPFRSPLLREYSLFLRVLRCFSSPGSLDTPMYSACRDGVSPPPGCPIRTPLDHSLPAAPQGVSSRGHVLHRPQTPRHPPCAFSRMSLRHILLVVASFRLRTHASPGDCQPAIPGARDPPEHRNETCFVRCLLSLPHLLRC